SRARFILVPKSMTRCSAIRSGHVSPLCALPRVSKAAARLVRERLKVCQTPQKPPARQPAAVQRDPDPARRKDRWPQTLPPRLPRSRSRARALSRRWRAREPSPLRLLQRERTRRRLEHLAWTRLETRFRIPDSQRRLLLAPGPPRKRNAPSGR